MIASRPKLRIWRNLASALLTAIVAATSAGAEVIVPWTPGNLLTPTVEVTVTPEPGGTYKYDYKITNDATSQQNARAFVLEIGGDVWHEASPRGWRFGQVVVSPHVHWFCLAVDPREIVEEHEDYTCSVSIAPGSVLSGFSIHSIHPPGEVSFWIQGEKQDPVWTKEEDSELLGDVTFDIYQDSVSGITTGPVAVQTCIGAADGTPCDDTFFCNGADTCLDESCSEHAGDPCPEANDGDNDCLESCDEDKNNCLRYDSVGSPCADDGNPCTIDACGAGTCDHLPGNAGAVCRPAQNACELDATCTGQSIVCPSSPPAPAGTACTDTDLLSLPR